MVWQTCLQILQPDVGCMQRILLARQLLFPTTQVHIFSLLCGQDELIKRLICLQLTENTF